ncbi:leucine-rich repeat-containing protein 47-like isoform X1 [Homarus americanus]|uniref:leucine-rich repeat-containing protein 47-like isoform X1 n=1 Tax=Homarus americanus TaxID=6706 RepID=UPI001C43A8A5|nr:leucine-rich repeat-containing protein 47-like isoform X1 [Homarus americanus]
MWPEVQQALDEKRYELVLSGDDINKKIEDEGLDPGLYELSHLNFLRVSKSPLVTISEDIGKLRNLTNLILPGNKIQTLPETIGNLEKMKLLDISINCLQSLPNGIGNLISLTTLNANNNELLALPNLEKCINLAILDVSGNKLSDFPDICHESLAHLADVKLTSNQINEIPTNVSTLPSLKTLDLGSNVIKVVPGELIDCVKLKDLNLKGNPLNDRRFRKLVESDRCLPRQVIDYIRQHCPRSENSKGGAPGKGKKGKGGKGKAKDEDEVDILCNELRVLSVKDTVPVVQVTTAAKDVRPYIVCCVLQGVDLSGDNLKKFISTQTKLHEGVCEKRLAATIATHDLAKIKGPLKFIAGAPEEIRIHPLVRGKEMSARELHVGLQQEAEAQRKHQKRNNITGLHKFLHLVDRWSLWPCLVDADGTVISLPPLTNAENTKITQETVNVFVEVTSSTSLGKAKEVIDSLILFSLQTGISPEKNAGGKDVLTIQQVRVVDEDGGLRVLYPSRTDLVFKNEKVRVVMPDK